MLRSTGLGSVNNVDLLAVLAITCEPDGSVCKCIQRIIGSDTDVQAGMDVCAALADKNVASENELSVRSLDTEALGLRVSAVLCGTNTFFMCHKSFLRFLTR